MNSKNRRVSLKKIRAPGGRTPTATPTYYNARPRAGGEPWASAVLLRLSANESAIDCFEWTVGLII